MTINETTSAAVAINAALVQGLHAFMASEALLNASDTEIERAALTVTDPGFQTANVPRRGCPIS